MHFSKQFCQGNLKLGFQHTIKIHFNRFVVVKFVCDKISNDSMLGFYEIIKNSKILNLSKNDLTESFPSLILRKVTKMIKTNFTLNNLYFLGVFLE